MNWQEELTKLLALGKWQDIKDDAVVKQKLSEVYAYEMHDWPCCDPVLESYFTNHRNKAKKKMITKTAPKSENFEIKKGKKGNAVVLTLKSKNIDVTNSNLTDELAVELLKENPKNINNFSIYPPEILNELSGTLPTSDELLKDVIGETEVGELKHHPDWETTATQTTKAKTKAKNKNK